MPTGDDTRRRAQPRSRELVDRLLHEIGTLVLELERARRARVSSRDLRATEQALDGLRWRLAAVARRAASEEGAAA
jgi:hypothetical protein